MIEAARAVLAACALVVASPAVAAAAATEPEIPREIVRMKVESAEISPSDGGLTVVLSAEIAEGWHVNAHRPSRPELVPTTLSVTPPDGFRVGEILYPAGERVRFAFAGGEELLVYQGTVRLRIPVDGDRRLDEAGASFVARLRYQACDDTRCLRPTEAERTFLVKAPPGSGSSGAAAARAASNEAPVAEWLASRGLAFTLLTVLVMGLGLNLTPCVYPLVSVTIAYFGGQARESRGRVLLLAATYALGIVLTFSTLGVAAALSGGLFGRALAYPPTLVALALLMVALALSSFGAFTLRPPSWLLRSAGGSAMGFAGALFMGLTMGVVAAPCVGPIVVGLLVAVGSRGDPALGFLLFFTLGVGLGAPYVALAASAGSLARMPRSGEWLVWIEHLFGFVLLGLALYFVGPLLDDATARVLAAVLLGVAGAFLGFVDPSLGRGTVPSRAAKVAGIAAVAAAVWTAMPPPQHEALAWQPFSKGALEAAREDGRPVVVDFRADWCLPCIEMEETTFVAPEVRAEATGFTMLRADVTDLSPENEKLLSEFEVHGVPTTLFYDRLGTERERRIGYVDPGEFSKLLREVGAETKRARGSSPAGPPGS